MSESRWGTPLGVALDAIATQANEGVGRWDSAGVTLIDGGRVRGRGWTDEVERGLDDAQAESTEGRCVDALRFLQIFNVASIPDSGAWPAFRGLAATHGVVSSLSVPLFHRGQALGAINLCSRVRNGSRDCEWRAMAFASAAAAALGGIEAGPTDAVVEDGGWRLPSRNRHQPSELG